MDRLSRRLERLETLIAELFIRRAVHRIYAQVSPINAQEQTVKMRRKLRCLTLVQRFGRRHPAVRVLMTSSGISDATLDWHDALNAATRAGLDVEAWVAAHPCEEE